MPAAPRHDGELYALEAREALGSDELAPIEDIVAEIETKAGVPIFLAPLPGSIAGLAHRLDGRWYIVGDTSAGPPGRLRFTIAHEFGHIWMGHEPSIDDQSTLNWSRPEHDKQEVAANYFAAEFLMPRAMVMAAMEGVPADLDLMDILSRLARSAKTTLWVPLYRLSTLGLVDPRERRDLGDRIQQGKHDHPSGVGELDVAGVWAGTRRVRMPAGHEERLLDLGDLAPGRDVSGA